MAAGKASLRKEISRVLGNLSEFEKAQQSELVFKKLIAHQQYKQASRLSIYLSTNNEINTEPILRRALEVDKKRCFVPVVLKRSIQGAAELIGAGPRMVMYELRSMGEFERLPVNHYGIKEPQQIDASRLAGSLDLLVAPGVAFDLAGRRLGHGKGYYDEYLTHWTKSRENDGELHSIGLAFREQIVADELPFVEGRDFRLNEVLCP